MTATGHALIGTLIAAKFNNPYIALPLSFASHFVADMIPHWDSGTHWRKKTPERLILESIWDVLIGFGLSFILYTIILQQYNYLLLFATIVSSQLLDWMSAPYFLFHIKDPVSRFTSKIQTSINSRLDKPWGIVTQIATVVILYVVLFRVF